VTGSRKVRKDGGGDNLLRLVGIQTESNSEVYGRSTFPGFPCQEKHFYYLQHFLVRHTTGHILIISLQHVENATNKCINHFS
jgi:hypothetical protein